MRSSSLRGKLMPAMLAAVADMERDLLVERTQSGLACAKAEGKTFSRPPKATAAQRAAMIQDTGESVSSLWRLWHVQGHH